MNTIVLEAYTSSKEKIRQNVAINIETLFDDVEKFTDELESKMKIGAWKTWYNNQNLKSFDVTPYLVLDSFVCCIPCDIDVTVKNIDTEIETKISNFINELRKEIAFTIFCRIDAIKRH